MKLDKFNFSEYNIFGKNFDIPYEYGKGGTKEKILVYSTVLFAMNGYTAVSMKNIASETGIQSASLYNHFMSKQALWHDVVSHAEQLYRLFFDTLSDSLMLAKSIDEMLDIIFLEPEKMNNQFTCFAFSLIQSEQFRDEFTWNVFSNTFIKYPLEALSNHFNRAIELGYARPFDVISVSGAILSYTLREVCIYTQKLMGRELPYDPIESLKRYHAHILNELKPNK